MIPELGPEPPAIANLLTHDFNVTHEGPVLDSGHGHPDGESPHQHESFFANLYVGKRPQILPWTQQATNLTWTSQWSTGGS